MMGTGKTTVATLLGHRLNRAVVDSDALIEAREGRTVREIWLSDGEAGYRDLETAALRDALASAIPTVIAAAGGVVLRADNRVALRSGPVVVVWLDASPEILVGRVAGQGHRPLLDDDPLGTLRQMQIDRADLYAEVADERIDTEGRSPVDVADLIVSPS
jgi:shikimate kinase